MDHSNPKESQQIKGSMLWHREHADECVKKRPAGSSASPLQDVTRPIRRVRSPSRPRARLPKHYAPKTGGQLNTSRENPSSYKPGSGHQRHHYFHPLTYVKQRDHYQLKYHHLALREKEREKEKEPYEQRESSERSSPPKQESPFLPRSTSSRDKDTQLTAAQSNRNQSRKRDHRGTKSRERERNREGELPSTASQMVARDKAIQQKRREIDEVYYHECEIFGLVAKMLIAKDQSLERSIQASLQENLRDIGKRCVEAMEKFIEDYDSRELSLKSDAHSPSGLPWTDQTLKNKESKKQNVAEFYFK